MKANLKLLAVNISSQEFSSLVNMARFIKSVSPDSIKECGLNAQELKYMADRIFELDNGINMQINGAFLEVETSSEDETSTEEPESYESSSGTQE